MRMYADRKEWPLEKILQEIGFEPDEAVSKFPKRVIFIGDLSAEERQRLLAVRDKCQVRKTFSNPIEIISVIK